MLRAELLNPSEVLGTSDASVPSDPDGHRSVDDETGGNRARASPNTWAGGAPPRLAAIQQQSRAREAAHHFFCTTLVHGHTNELARGIDDLPIASAPLDRVGRLRSLCHVSPVCCVVS